MWVKFEALVDGESRDWALAPEWGCVTLNEFFSRAGFTFLLHELRTYLPLPRAAHSSSKHWPVSDSADVNPGPLLSSLVPAPPPFLPQGSLSSQCLGMQSPDFTHCHY